MANTLDLGKVTGSQMHNVTSAPAASLGLLGDWALNTASGDVYEKTAESTWTKRGNFKGATGAAGAKGAPGATGPQGAKGDTGAAGAVGAKGATGVRGSRWDSGTAITGTSTTAAVFSGTGITDALVNDMYLNTSTGYTYRCTVAGAASAAKWVYAGSIKGIKGDTGAAGAQGPKGDTGATGPSGAKGATGATGPAGANGQTPTFSIDAAGHLIATFSS